MANRVALQLALFHNDRHWTWCTSRPSHKPANRFSVAYCLWLAKSHRQRYEALQNQGFKCWECRELLSPRWMHLHHPYGYANLGYEEATDLRGVHAICHRRIHERDQRARSVCGCAAA
jgi:hypothetical protein